MSTYRVQHSIQDVDELSQDRYVNTFHFSRVGDASSSDLDNLCTVVRGFYTNPDTPATIAAYYASHCGGDGSTVKAYKEDTALAHEPLASQTFVFPCPTTGVDNMPGEVALVLSLRSLSSPEIPIGRRRGRIYLGPLNSQTQIPGEEAVPCRPNAAFISSILASAQRLKTQAATNGFNWVVHSPTLMDALAPISDFWVDVVSVDDAYDIQRRRGVDPSTRVSLTLV